MDQIITQFAAAHGEKANLLQSLGIDWKMLVLQTAAFLILLAILKKWVYPPLMAMLDQREKDLRAADKAAKSARENADKTEKMINEMMRKARVEANEIVKTAQAEAAVLAEEASAKAAAKSEAMLKAARDDIAKEVTKAKQALHDETLALVAEATGAVLGKKVDAKADAALISAAVKEAQG